MSWYAKVNKYIDENLMDFIKTFFGDGANTQKISNGIRVNPSPCCGHNDSFSFATQKNAYNCFSCGRSGNKINSLQLLNYSDEEIKKELSKWSGVDYVVDRAYDERTKKEIERQKRLELVYELAIKHYEIQLRNESESKALYHQTGIRKHQDEFLRKYRVGYSSGVQVLQHVLSNSPHNLTQDEIDEAKKLIAIPDGYFVYPYYDKSGKLIRINTKLYERICNGNQRDDGSFEYNCGFRTHDLSKEAKEDHLARPNNAKHVLSSDGFSRGEKTNAFYFANGSLRKKKFAILIEGENDVISTDEAFVNLPEKYKRDFAIIGLGGQMDEESFDSLFLRQFEKIYEAFDHDEAGDKYRKLLDEKLPDIPVYSLEFDADYNDIDAYLKSGADPNFLKDAIDNAVYRDTPHFIISRDTKSHKWTLKNRKFEIIFDVNKLNSKGFVEGTISVNKGGQPVYEKYGDLGTARLDTYLNTPRLHFARHIKEYYQGVDPSADYPKRSFEELLDIFPFTDKKQTVIRHLAWYLAKKDIKEFEEAAKRLNALGQTVKDEVLQEVNSAENQKADLTQAIPTITLSQFFNVTNNDAFFYFSKYIEEDNNMAAVPYLITNKKEEIRLDLLKKSTPQSILLIKNKYQLPTEVPVIIMNPNEVSLQRYWVDKWKDGQLPSSEYDPSLLIKKIEDFINSCYYLRPDTTKVLSLWIYATYFYTLFDSGFPYLLITGEKGTGKTTADMLIYLLSLNPKLALQMSEASLFRAISQQGGTFILDEIENLNDKRSVDNNAVATILKGGYSDTGKVYRTNMENGVAMIEEHSAFGPKVISNINGLDDVIGDRCIYIKTVRAPESRLKDLKNVHQYKKELRHVPHEITSKCAISALEHFKTVHNIYYDTNTKVATGNARLSQIILPLVTMAKFVGGDYEAALMRFYDKDIAPVKEELSITSQEGMVKNILKTVASELTGTQSGGKWATDFQSSIYPEPIHYEPSTGIFQIDLLHFLTLAEASNNGVKLEIGSLRNTIKQLFENPTEYKNRTTKKSVPIMDEGFQRRLDGKKRMFIEIFTFNVNDYLTDEQKKSMTGSHIPETSLF